MSSSRINNTNCLGRKLSEKTKEKISNSLKEYYSSRPGTWFQRKHSKETILKLKNRKFSDSTKALMKKNHSDVSGAKNHQAKKIWQFSLDGKFIKEYGCMKDALTEVGICHKSLTNCCKDFNKSGGGYRWRYADEESE